MISTPISTQNLSALPDIPALRRLTQSLAMLDAILSPEWDLRYYSFNAHWAEGEMMASMRDGSGDDWFLLFCKAGAVLKGFAHELQMAQKQTAEEILSHVPAVFNTFLTQPAFSLTETTFCIWRTVDDDQWRTGAIEYPSSDNRDDPDGSLELLALLDGTPTTYQQWAEEYFEVEVDLAAVEHIYQHRPLTSAIVSRLNAEVILDDLAGDLLEIGYPS